MSVGLGFFPRLPGMVPPECKQLRLVGVPGQLRLRQHHLPGVTSACARSSAPRPASPRITSIRPSKIGELPAASRPIIAALESVRPAGGTPSHAALEGAIRYARGWTASKGRWVAIALATDGEPTNCGEKNSIESISALARQAAAEGLPTFVVGVGSQLDNLNAIAAAGGTGKAYLVEGYDVEEQFLSALQAIQGAAARLSCSYGIPAPPAGQVLDPMKVNDEPNAGTPARTTVVGQVAEKARCDGRGGWYYDNPAKPGRSTCATPPARRSTAPAATRSR